MKKHILYMCEFCNTQYKNEGEALQCEKNHHKPKEVKRAKYHAAKSDKDGYPDFIEVVFDDGKVIKYKR